MRRLLLLLVCSLAPLVFAQSTDLQVRLTLAPTAIGTSVDATASGTLTITNAGSVPAKDVFINFSGLLSSFAPWPFQGTMCSSPLAPRCEVPEIVPGSWSLPVMAKWLDTPLPGTVETMTVTISSPYTPDPDLTNNTTSASTTVLWQSNLTFDDLKPLSPAVPGKIAVISASYSNHGPSPATDLSITISIPPGTKYEGYYADNEFDCTEPPVGGQGDLVCKAVSYLILSPDSVEAVVSVDPSLAPGTVLPLNGTLTSTSAVQSPVTATGSLAIVAPGPPDANLTVAATIDKPSVAVGGLTEETFTITNAGPHEADGVTLDIRLPKGSSQAGLSWTSGSCLGGPPINCTLPTLAPGATMTVTAWFWAHIPGTSTSTAVATSLNGGITAASTVLVVTPSRHREARH